MMTLLKNGAINFVRISVKNNTSSEKEARVVAALRGKLDDSRFVDLKGFDSSNLHEVKGSSVYRDGKLLCWLDPSYSKIESIEGKNYAQPYTAESVKLTPATRTVIMHYQKKLKPSKSIDYFFKLPAVPVSDVNVDNQILGTFTDYPYFKAYPIVL